MARNPANDSEQVVPSLQLICTTLSVLSALTPVGVSVVKNQLLRLGHVIHRKTASLPNNFRFQYLDFISIKRFAFFSLLYALYSLLFTFFTAQILPDEWQRERERPLRHHQSKMALGVQ